MGEIPGICDEGGVMSDMRIGELVAKFNSDSRLDKAKECYSFKELLSISN